MSSLIKERFGRKENAKAFADVNCYEVAFR
jgi:hypothetical protein